MNSRLIALNSPIEPWFPRSRTGARLGAPWREEWGRPRGRSSAGGLESSQTPPRSPPRPNAPAAPGRPVILVSHPYRFIYLKTAKTAGTSVEIYFEPLCVPDPQTYVAEHATDMKVSEAGVIGLRAPQARNRGVAFFGHMHAAEVRAAVGETVWSQYLKFAVVRDPFDKVVSAFWASHKRDPALSTAALAAGATDFAAVKARFRAWVEEKQGRVSMDREVYTIDDAIVVDRLIRYETLAADVEAVRQAIGAPALSPLAHFKGGARRLDAPFAAYYCARTRDLVADAFAWEIERFGYAPPELDGEPGRLGAL